MKGLFFVLTFSIVVFLNHAESKEIPCALTKKVPFLVQGCEGEACGFTHYYYALKDFKLHKEPSEKSKIIGEIKKCELLKKIEPYFIRIQFAKTKVIKVDAQLEKLGVQIGDILTVKQYQGEGFQDVCVKDSDLPVEEGNQVKVISQGKTEEWVKVTNQKNLVGWSKRDVETIMWAYTSDDSKKCSPDHKLRGL